MTRCVQDLSTRSWWLIALAACLVSGGAAEAEPATAGLYPLWEDTGHILSHRRAELGWSHAGFGVLDRAQLELAPSSLLLRVPNLGVKLSVRRGERLDVAVKLAGYVFLPGASEAFLSPSYSSGWQNLDFTVLAVPLSAAASLRVNPWVSVHHTTTLLAVTSNGPIESSLTPGNYLTVELRAYGHHSFMLHGAEIGLWDHDLFTFGASWRYARAWFQAQLGYVYRVSDQGLQTQPLVNVGVRL